GELAAGWRATVTRLQPDADRQGGQIAMLAVPPGQSSVVAAQLAADRRVAWAEPDRRMHIADEPNDPCYQQAAACPGAGQVDQNDFRQIHAPQAWSITHGSASIRVAVLD